MTQQVRCNYPGCAKTVKANGMHKTRDLMREHLKLSHPQEYQTLLMAERECRASIYKARHLLKDKTQHMTDDISLLIVQP